MMNGSPAQKNCLGDLQVFINFEFSVDWAPDRLCG